jgi:hypothetical protein
MNYKEVKERHESMERLLKSLPDVELPKSNLEKNHPYTAKQINQLYQDRAYLLGLVEECKIWLLRAYPNPIDPGIKELLSKLESEAKPK